MLERRTFLLTGVLGGGAVLTLSYRGWMPGLAGFRLGSRPVYFLPGGKGAQLLATIEALDATDALGEAWLESQPEAPDFTGLMRSLVDLLPSGGADPTSAIAASVRRDFAGGRLCEVAGWRLSLTECRLAGLRRLAVQEGLLAPNAVTAPPVSAYALGDIAPVKNWGPQHTLVGEPFNVQLDGHSGIWFRIEGAPAHARIMIDGRIARTSVSEKTVTSGLRGAEQDRILSNPGRYEIALVDPIRKIKQPVGHLEVREKASQGAQRQGRNSRLCAVEKWGPRRTRVGVAANERPDGSMGLWLRTDCLPKDVRLLFGDDHLDYRRKDFGLTAHVPLALLGAPGRVPLSLYHPGSGEKLVFGHLVIE